MLFRSTITPAAGEGEYILKPAPGQKNLHIHIDATIDKKVQRIGSAKFIVKDIPAPVIKLSGVESGGRIAKKDLSANSVVIPLKSPDFLLKVDSRSIRIVKMTVAVGPKEETVNGPRFNEAIASLIRKATKGDKLSILAEVMQPDGKTKQVTYTATLK